MASAAPTLTTASPDQILPAIPVPYLVEFVAFLVTVVIIVPLFKKIKLSLILGYLAVGAVIGPYALAIVSDIQGVVHFAELGVVFLLFTIGLELSFQRLKAFTHLIFGLGATHRRWCNIRCARDLRSKSSVVL